MIDNELYQLLEDMQRQMKDAPVALHCDRTLYAKLTAAMPFELADKPRAVFGTPMIEDEALTGLHLPTGFMIGVLFRNEETRRRYLQASPEERRAMVFPEMQIRPRYAGPFTLDPEPLPELPQRPEGLQVLLFTPENDEPDD